SSVQTFRVGRFAAVRHAHHHQEIQIPTGHVARFDHFLRRTAFGGTLNIAIGDPADGGGIEVWIGQVALKLPRSADFEGKVAADEHAEPSVGAEVVDGSAARVPDFIAV